MSARAMRQYQRDRADRLAVWYKLASDPTRIESLGVSTMTRNALLGAHIATIDQLCARTLPQVKQIHGLGKAGRDLLLDALAKRGRALAPEKTKPPASIT